jgi:CRP-like cAMP-binding protein
LVISEPMRQDLENILTKFGKPKLIHQHHIYISEGQIFKSLFFIRKGILRSYCISENGDEKTILFAAEGLFYGVIDSIYFNRGSTRFWQALEATELIELDFGQTHDQSNLDLEVLKLRVHFLELLLIDSVQRLESFVRDTSEKRYLDLVDQKRDLISRIPDKYIASYIGVTPVTLSRIRSRLASSKNLQ